MSKLAISLAGPILIGLGATLTFDLWALFLEYAFKVPPSNICLIGRWIRYMQEGTFRHHNIRSVPQKSRECALGWIAHYMIGIAFAVGFIASVGLNWLQHPTLLPALMFGCVTALAPFFIMQPAFGLGIAASKTSGPWQARFRSLMNHLAFGIGLYAFGWLANWWLWSSR